MSERDELGQAFDHFIERLRDAETAVRGMQAYEGDRARARGYEHLARMMLKSLEQEVLQDPDHPHFRVLDDRIREGGDNPDQRYLLGKLRGGEAYRVWGRLGSAHRLEIQLYSEEPYGGKNVGVGYLPHQQVDFAHDGSFSIELGPGVAGRSTLVNPADAAIIQVRQIYDDWNEDDPGVVYIDRVGYEGHRKGSETAATMAERLRLAGDNTFHSTECWPALVERGVLGFMEVNTMPPVMSPGDRAGVVGRWISLGHFDLGADDALVIRIPPTTADYRGIQLSDLWFASLPYGNATSSLSGAQSLIAPDGYTYFVISLSDPGYANWLDPCDLPRGTVHIRYDGVEGEIPAEAWPSATLSSVSELSDAIPEFEAGSVSGTGRNDQRAARRRHVQVRYGR
ncbi:MAG: hypothetical protein P8J50_10935 [Acidimicrobiales bacterium]|jgi:hypothetical protein|nr:hypothetical protein [Acidimicrobiales bacterium]